nr:hypothetical protein [uncultured Dubosiella sp.]
MSEENKKVTPPPVDPKKMNLGPAPWYKKKETIIGFALVAVVLVGIIVGAVAFANFKVMDTLQTIAPQETYDYRLLNQSSEYIVNEDADIVLEPMDSQVIGKVKKDDIVWCENTAYVDETEALWGQLKNGWIPLRDHEKNYASENVLREVESDGGELELEQPATTYEDPSLSAPEAGQLEGDQRVPYEAIYQDLSGNEWFQLENGAWLHREEGMKKIVAAPSSKKKEEAAQTDEETMEEGEEIPTEFIAKYTMKIRKEPNLDAERTGTIQENQTVVISELKDGDEESVWGKIVDGDWVCMQDKEYTYFERADEDEEADTPSAETEE